MYRDTELFPERVPIEDFPSKVGTSSFGSFTPLLSETGGGEAIEVGVEDESFLLISTEESKMSFSREDI